LRKPLEITLIFLGIAMGLVLQSCGKMSGQTAVDPAVAGAPPAANVVLAPDAAEFAVDHPEQFPLAAAVARAATSELVVTGTVTPDVSRSVPVVSLASGRVMAIHTRLGDTVNKGDLLMTIRSDDVSGGYATYKMAVADETLAKAQLDRTKDLYEHGAMALNDVQVAQDVEDKAKIAVDTAEEHLKLLGNDPGKPAGMVDIFAPTSGVVTDQQVTVGALVQAYSTPYPFTISDLSNLWIICDVYENDLATVKLGDPAEIRLNAYPDRVFRGKVSNFLPILDPTIRTGKVRIEVENPGIMRLGMFVRATFRGQTTEMHTIIPASAIMDMHDRTYVFLPAPGNKFRRLEVLAGDVLKDHTDQREVKSGIKPGDQVVTNALVLDHVLAQ
jgi:cobalt-zinc-cadmium efflux system membrane fusion protein